MTKTKQTPSSRAPARARKAPPTKPAKVERVTRAQTMIDMMRQTNGATAAELGAAVGWQIHSVRGFIAGTLKKRSDLSVLAERNDGATRYRIVEKAEAQA
jgi:hypothetical protein